MNNKTKMLIIIGFLLFLDTRKIKGKIEMNNQKGFPGGFRSLVDGYRVEW